MRLPELLQSGSLSSWTLGERYEITRSPRGLQLPSSVPFASMEALPQGGQYDARFDDKPLEKLTSGTYFERGDILVSKITPSFENGKQALVRSLSSPFGYATTEVIPIRPKEKHRDARFLFFYLLHPDVRSFVAEKMEGTTGRQRVPDRVLLDLPVPEVSLQDETNIANVLETVQTAISIETSAEALSRRLKQATMHALFTRGLRGEVQTETEIGPVPTSWDVLELSEICSTLSGGTPPKHDRSLWSGTVPWVSGKDLKRNRLNDVGDHITSDAASTFSKVAPAESVLILIRGMGLAKSFALSLIERPMAFNQDLKALTPGPRVTGVYLMHALTYAGPRMLGNVTTAAHGTKRLVQSDIDRFRIPVPNVNNQDEQSQIVEILDVIDEKIDAHMKKRFVLEDLFKSLLHKLMTGEVRVSALNLSAIDQAMAAAVLA